MKNNLKYLIVLMSLATLGLLIFQVLWVKDALSLNQQQFEREALTAIHKVSQRLEQQEMAKLAAQEIDFQENNMLFMPPPMPQDSMFFQPYFEGESPRMGRRKKFPFKGRHKHKHHRQVLQLNIHDKDTQLVYKDTVFPDKCVDDQRVIRRTEVVTNLLRKMVFSSPEISQRIQPHELDSLLHLEMRKTGIDQPFEFAITDPSSGGLLVTQPHYDEQSLRQTKLRAALFPNDLTGTLHFLLVYFPEQNSIIWKKTAYVFWSSLVLVGVVIAGFGVSVHTILKQKKLSEMKDDFINNMTHEFKTPVATISLACEALQDPDMASNLQIRQRYLHIIGDENRRMSQQIEKVLQAARLDRDQWPISSEITNAHEILREVIENMNVQVQAAEGQIISDLQAMDYWINVDKMHFVSVLQNLLDNANKYSPSNPQITVRTYNEYGRWVLQVSDNGIGMSTEEQKRIFDKFYRVPTGNLHNVKGFGLGLSYVRTIAQAYGATIGVQSRPDKGSTFTIAWPLSSKE